MGSYRFARFSALLVLLGVSEIAVAGATGSGVLGNTLRDTNAGCGGCHGAQVTALGVDVSGPAAILPGQSGRYTINITNVTIAGARVGFNAALSFDATDQALFAIVMGEPTSVNTMTAQMIHNNARTESGGSASYLFDVVMPAGADLGDTYQLFAVANAGRSADQVGWDHATTQTIKVGPPTPTTLTANQANATTTLIPLTWSGTQGEHFRVLVKAGGFPTSATDAGASLVYEGSNTSANAMGLTAGTQYFFAAYGKAPANAVYSDNAAQTTAATRPVDPATLAATTAGATEVSLSWTGTATQFRVLGKAGSYPANATDGTAKLVYEGAAKNASDTNLLPDTEYFYRVWGKTVGAAVYSVNHAQDTATTAAMPADRYVNAATGDDQTGNNDCSVPASPCRTITQAMTRASGGDAIYVAAGVYDVALGEVFPITFKPGVQLLATGTPQQTIIDGANDPVHRGLFVLSGNLSQATRIEGFTLRNGLENAPFNDVSLGGAIEVVNGPNGLFTIERNIFRGNEARGYTADGEAGETGQFAWGGAVYVFSSRVVIRNNQFIGNIARGGDGLFNPGAPRSDNASGGNGDGGAIYAGGSISIVNNTFHGNLAIGGNGGQGSDGVSFAGPGRSGAVIVTGDPPGPTVANNIFSANAARHGAGDTSFDDSGPGALNASNAGVNSHNLYFGNTTNDAPSTTDDFGAQMLDADPRFHQAPDNLRLRLSSPANASGMVIAGVDTDFDGAARSPTTPSRGAFEASKVAQQIVFGVAPTVSAGSTGMVSATGGASGNPVVFSSATPGTCGVNGSTVSGSSPGTCTINANQAGNTDFDAAPQVQQSFAILPGPSFALTLTFAGSGSGMVTSSPAGLSCTANCSANFASGTPVTLTAQAAAGAAFAGWSGSGCSGTGNCQVTLDQARAVTATFTALTTFAVSISGAQEVPVTAATATGSGTATINPVANTITYDFAVSPLTGALTMAHFHGPAARGASAGPKITTTAMPYVGVATYLESDEAGLLNGLWYVNYHTAMFPGGEVRGQLDNLGGLLSLQAARIGAGSGRVTSSPSGIDCGTQCLSPYTEGAMVVLTATPEPGSMFAGWSGDCSGTADTCQVTLDQVRSATARFEPIPDLPEDIFANGFEAEMGQ